MATDARELAGRPIKSDVDADPKADWYDRSSLKGDFTVMIADQTEEEYLRRRPAGRPSRYMDGIVYLDSHASNLPGPEDDPDDPTKVWYDRSSLIVDAMVMIPDQTLDDYLRRAPENETCEYIDGTVYMPSPASLRHQFGASLLAFLLIGFTSHRQAGHLLGGPASVKVGERRFLAPEVDSIH